MSQPFPRITYSGSTPGADSNVYNLFSTVAAFPGGNLLAGTGAHKLMLDLSYSKICTLKTYKSIDRGTTWYQTKERLLLPPFGTQTYRREFALGQHADFKLDLVNGGTAQTSFAVDLALSDLDFMPLEALDFIYAATGYNNDLTGSITGDWVDCQDADNVIWDNDVSGTVPTGVFTYQGTHDPARTSAIVNACNLTNGLHQSVAGAGTVAVTNSSGSLADQVTVTGYTGKFAVNISNPFKWMRQVYTRSSGGAATGLKAWVGVFPS